MKMDLSLPSAILLLSAFAAAAPSVDSNSIEAKRTCGVRSIDLPANSSWTDDFATAGLRAQSGTFPWLAVLDTDTQTCSGGFVSEHVVAVPAHCVSGVPAQEMRLREVNGAEHKVESVVVHPKYKADHPSHQHDLALIKLEGVQSQGKGDYRTACLPKEGDDPVDHC